MSTALIWQTVSTSSADTERLGQLLGQVVKSPEVIELRSDLGGGKTTFVRGLARGLGSKDAVASPTFTLNRIYKCKKGVELRHFDLYRLNKPGIVADQLAESLENPNAVTIVEWSDIVQSILPDERLSITFKLTANNPNERQISIYYPEAKTGIVKKLETNWQRTRP